MQLKLDRKFKERMQARFQRFDMEVGILKDKPHKDARPATDGTSSYAGGPVRKKAGGPSWSTVAEVSASIREMMPVNYLTDPFQHKNADINKFSTEFFKVASSGTSSAQRKLMNLLQAIVRNPILRGDYGSNKTATIREKSFDRYLIDTGQFFRAITASIKIKGTKDV